MKRYLLPLLSSFFILGILTMLGGCQNNELPEGEVRLSKIPDNPDYESLPLKGTPWKLVGFVDERQKRVKLAEPAEGNSYRLTFLGNGEFVGTTYINGNSGKYEVSEVEGRLVILQFGLTTFAGEVYDSPLYVESFKKVHAFHVSSQGLELYYDTQKYLLFRPLEYVYLNPK